MERELKRDHRIISWWLFAGVFLVFVQIMLGGITRLTGSGLSITRWEIVTGTVPPLNEAQWMETFGLYKLTPQYTKINEGMELKQFKFIFFWEYIHRLWARLMGIVFLVPFVVFLFRRSLSPWMLRRLAVVVLLAVLAALFGWIMVASGLINRPWVNAYKLTVHLGLGALLFIYLFFTWLHHRGFTKFPQNASWNNAIKLLILLAIIQIMFGGFVSGMKSALLFPTWPKMHGEWIPSILMDGEQWNTNNLLMYDETVFMPALAQFMHRNLAYLLSVLFFVFTLNWIRKLDAKWHWVSYCLVGIIVVQVGLGILTLRGSIGSIPVLYGSLHQGMGILLLTFLIYTYSIIKSPKY